MRSSAVLALLLSVPSFSTGLSEPFTASYGTILSVVEVWEPDVTVTQWSTETVSVMCHCCQAGGEFYALATSTATSSSPALWSKAASAAPTTTLIPVSHWSQDASSPEILIPAHDAQIYYAPSGVGSKLLSFLHAISYLHISQILTPPTNINGLTLP